MSYELHAPNIFPAVCVKQEAGWTPEPGRNFMRGEKSLAPNQYSNLGSSNL